MRKFTVIHSKGTTTIQEVEIELVTGLEDSSVTWFPKGEYRAKVLAPVSLYEKDNHGKSVPAVWHSFAFYDTEGEAKDRAKRDIKGSMEREACKSGNHNFFDYDACDAKCKEIQVSYLKSK